MSKITILIADDYELVRRGVRHTLMTNPDWEVVAEVSNGQEAVEVCERLPPDIAVLDLSMPKITGLEAIRQIHKQSPQIRILALSIHDSDTMIHEVLAAGAMGYLLKSDAASDLLAAVQSLVDGRPFLTARVSQALLDNFLHPTSPRRPEQRPALTRREQQLVRLIADGHSNKEIAASLNISIRTVETHRRHIMKKLGLHSVSGLILYAFRTGLKDPSQ